YCQGQNSEQRYSAEVQAIRMAMGPAIKPFPRWWGVPDFLFENTTALVNEEVADVGVPGVIWVGELGQCQHFAGDLFFGALDSFCDVLDDVPVVIASPECHRGVVPARILTQQFFRRALGFDEILPVESRDSA